VQAGDKAFALVELGELAQVISWRPRWGGMQYLDRGEKPWS
jgi:hypothetical protein